MKPFSLSAIVLSGIAFAQGPMPATTAAMPAATKLVYLLPMAGGLDQYLAGWITREHVLQVTADPVLADLVLTDKLGMQLQKKLVEISPRESDDDVDTTTPRYAGGAPKGSLFLIDVKTRNVLWSDFQKPATGSSGKLNREAHRLARKLQLSLTGKDKP